MAAKHSEQGKIMKYPLILLASTSRQKDEIKLPLNSTQTHDLDLQIPRLIWTSGLGGLPYPPQQT